MAIVNLQDSESDLDISTNICIIGSGAAGSILAIELSNLKNNNICIIESGDYKQNINTQKLYDMNITGEHLRENFINRVRQYGGSCSIWPGRTILFKKSDLDNKSWINKSGWPIDYSELLTYYQRAFPYLSLPKIEKYDYNYWFKKCNLNEKLFFNENIDPTISIWSKSPERFSKGSRHQKLISKKENITTILNSNLYELLFNDSKEHIKSAKFKSLNQNTLTIKADVYILACGGIENARLLLSMNRQIPSGIGNQNDIVGRYFMEHPKIVKGNLVLNKPMSIPLFTGQVIASGRVRIGFCLSEQIRRERELLNPYCTIAPVSNIISKKAYSSITKIAKRILKKGYVGKRTDFKSKTATVPDMIYELPPQDLMPHLFNVLSRQAKIILGLNKMKKLQLVNYCEQEPNRDSRVMLNREKDILGLNKISLDWRISRRDIDSLICLHEVIAENIKRNKFGYLTDYISSESSIGFSDASHHMGTTRMAENPNYGVVDKNCKVHYSDNLYISGSSVFPTSGHANPTLTIAALSIRLSDHINNKINK